MFNWNVEEMKLLNMDLVGDGYDQAFACESEVSIEEKFEFIDRMQDSRLSYLVGMVKAYQEAIPSMKKDAEGKPTDYAKKAWVRQNDTQNLFHRKSDSHGKYGDFEILGYTGNLFSYANREDSYYLGSKENSINQLFHRQLGVCKNMEYNYFCSHDKTVKCFIDFENKYNKHVLWGIACKERYSICVTRAKNESDKGEVYFLDRKNRGCNGREFTLEEVQQINAELTSLDILYDQLQKAQQSYEEARWSVAKKIKSMATN